VCDDVGIISQSDFGYTFQRNLPDTGLMDYKARFYDPYITQFSQPDTIIPDLYNPQNLNRYSYVNNSPVNYNDPAGHKACGFIDQNGDCDDSEEKFLKLINFVETKIFNKNGRLRNKRNDLGAMTATVEKAAEIYGNDWDHFLSVTNYVFIGVYENGPFSQVHAQQSGFKGYSFSASGFSNNFDDGQNQVRHFWGAFATAASNKDELPFGPYWTIPNSTVAKVGNFMHDLVEDWYGYDYTTVKDFSLSQEAIAIGKDVRSGRIASPSELPAIMQDQLSSGSWYYRVNNYLLRWLWKTPYK
jgi:RHS repeat-associated protein